MSFKVCPKCNCEKPYSEYYKSPSSRSKDKLQSWCKVCSRISSNTFVKKQSAERRELLGKIKCDSGCVDCGYNNHPSALDFDHLSIKNFDIAGSLNRPWKDILEEIKLCEVVCANCHRIRTYNRKRNNVLPISSSKDCQEIRSVQESSRGYLG